MGMMEDKRINESLFNRVIDFVFFGGIDKVVDKAEKDLEKEDPEAHQGIVGTINKAQRQIDKVNAEMEEYCKKYPHKKICKDYKKNGPRSLDMKW